MKQTNNPTTTTDNQLRTVSRLKLGNLSRALKNAMKRQARLEGELQDVRTIISRKYIIIENSEGKTSRSYLSPAQIQGLSLKRDEIDADLALAKRECLDAEKKYRKAIQNNKTIQRNKTKEIKEQNLIIRNQNALLKKTHNLINEHGKNSGAAQVLTLKSLALDGDVKSFRVAFDEAVEKFEPEHYTTISGVNQVKTEIIHSVMEAMATEAKSNSVESLSVVVGA